MIRERGCIGVFTHCFYHYPSTGIAPCEVEMRECAFARPRVRSGLEKVGQRLYSIRAGEIWKEDPEAPRAE